MQLVKGLKPITIGVISLTSPFLYADFNSNSRIIINEENSETIKFVQQSDENNYYGLVVQNAFFEHLQKWEEETMGLSSINKIISNKNFQWIISNNRLVVPLIIEEIDKNPSTLVWSLNIIFGHKISNDPNLTIREACKLWVKHLRAKI